MTVHIFIRFEESFQFMIIFHASANEIDESRAPAGFRFLRILYRSELKYHSPELRQIVRNQYYAASNFQEPSISMGSTASKKLKV